MRSLWKARLGRASKEDVHTGLHSRLCLLLLMIRLQALVHWLKTEGFHPSSNLLLPMALRAWTVPGKSKDSKGKGKAKSK